ncbi:MAG TPA: cysteine desulfurase [Candidatus Eisenbacteria bacterium]|jgi:cysteine desulfurase/selenocysteine lyase|nr:cysteine desulfurase [Candidatus Eisenbacteria bacterium]
MKTLAPVDFAAIRKQFPIFDRKIHGHPLVYLDSTATTQKPVAVLDALERYYRTYNANIHRGVYVIGEEATQAYEDARGKVAKFLNAASPREIVFTRGTTESVNLVAHGWGRKFVGPGDVVLLTEMEHHSNLVPWQLLAQDRGATLRFIPIDDDGRLDLTNLDRLLEGAVKIVSLAHVSNVLGTINPVSEIIRRAHARGARVMLDAAQSVPHMPVDVRALDCDFLALSGHKMLGPTGIGVLYGKREALESMNPFLGGGEMIREVRLEGSTWNEVPFKFEAGTMNIADTIAFGAAIDYLEGIGMANVEAHGRELVEETFRILGEIPGVTIYGPPANEPRGAIVSFTVDDIHAHDVAAALDREGVAVRAGHHCAMPLHTKLGVTATSRASFHVYNVPDDIQKLGDGIRKAKQLFHR